MDLKEKKTMLLTAGILIIILSILVLFLNKDSSNNSRTFSGSLNEKTRDDKEVILFNNILQNAKNVDSTKDCNELKDNDLKESCSSQIKLRFSIIGQAKTSKDCDSIDKENEYGTIERQKDICLYNVVARMEAKLKPTMKPICEKIKEISIKDLCIATIETKK